MTRRRVLTFTLSGHNKDNIGIRKEGEGIGIEAEAEAEA